ncbi:MAG: caspase family protein [Vicinamibacterales bacterium]
MATRRALLFGIDDYANIRPLDGCANDSRLVRRLLVERFGFPEANVTQLLNAEATRAAMLAAFDALIAATGDDDVVVVHYAGHGSQMRDREGDEPSGFDSTLMPWDTGRAPLENRDITDDEIHLKLEALSAKTPHITLLVDACHSGTITRDAFGAKTRAVEPDLRPVSQLPPSPIPGGRLPRTRSGASGWLPLGDRYVLISGCRDDEEAMEYVPADGSGPNGALTYFLCQELGKAAGTTTYRDVFEAVSARVTAYNRGQHPQMEGTADKVIFGVTELPPAPFVAVTARTGASVTLGAGSAQGVTAGSSYAVQPAGAKTTDAATALGTVVVRTVAPFSAEADVTAETGAGITPGTRAFETRHAHDGAPLAVQLADPDAEAAFGARLAASALLGVAAGATPAVRVSLLPARTAVGPGDPVPQAGPLADARWAVVDRTGSLVMPLKARGDVETVVQNLEKVARAARVLALDNPVPGRLRGAVTLDVLRHAPDGSYVPAAPPADGGQVEIDEGQRVRFQITNHHDRPLFVAVLYIGTGAEITVPAHLQLAPGVTDGSLTGPITFPPNYPFVDLGDPFTGVDAVETVKLVVSEEAVDFSGLAQAAVRSAGPIPARSPLAASLQRAAGISTRGFAVDPAPAPAAPSEPDWTVHARSLLVRRRATTLTAAPAAVGQAVVSAPALTGTLGTGLGADGRDDTADFATAALHGALQAADVAMKQTLVIDGARPAGAATRGAETAPVAVQLRPPPDGYGQMVLAADELGVVSWAFAESAPATRGDGRAGGRTYTIPGAVPQESPGSPGTRGVIGLVGRKVIKELVFPILEPMLGRAGASAVHWLETARWPYRVRAFTPDDYTRDDVPAIDGDGWRRLGAGRALLMVHGTFSRSHLAFAALPREDVETLHRMYGGRVFAFDHLFLSEDPAENVRWLASRMPDDVDLTFDIVCHSRGGLVSRVLAEKQGELSLGSRRVRVGKVVLVGVPNAGTVLADPAHVQRLLDVFTNLVNFLPDQLGTPVLTMLVEFAKLAAIGALDALPGLRSMHPAGDFARWLNAPADADGTRYFAVASNMAPSDPGLRHFVRSRALDALFHGGNDLVVPSAGAFTAEGASLFPVPSPLLLDGDAAVAHTKYFADPAVRRQVLGWLGTA